MFHKKAFELVCKESGSGFQVRKLVVHSDNCGRATRRWNEGGRKSETKDRSAICLESMLVFIRWVNEGFSLLHMDMKGTKVSTIELRANRN